MSHTVTLQQRIQELKKLQADLPKIMEEAARAGTQAAVQAAADATPPKAGTGRGSAYSGTNTLTGALKQRWATDTDINPQRNGMTYRNVLRNNQQYASYVNDGHRMDRHFVPGLYVNPYSGLLEYDPAAKTGIVVGTKTKYVKGEYMAEKGVEAYRKTVRAQLDKAIVEAMNK